MRTRRKPSLILVSCSGVPWAAIESPLGLTGSGFQLWAAFEKFDTVDSLKERNLFKKATISEGLRRPAAAG